MAYLFLVCFQLIYKLLWYNLHKIKYTDMKCLDDFGQFYTPM